MDIFFFHVYRINLFIVKNVKYPTPKDLQLPFTRANTFSSFFIPFFIPYAYKEYLICSEMPRTRFLAE
jgi:hypothetical protein